MGKFLKSKYFKLISGILTLFFLVLGFWMAISNAQWFMVRIFFYSTIVEAEIVRFTGILMVLDFEYLLAFMLISWAYYLNEYADYDYTIFLMRKRRGLNKIDEWESIEVNLFEIDYNDLIALDEAEAGFFSLDDHPISFKSRRLDQFDEIFRSRVIYDDVGDCYVDMSLLLNSNIETTKRYWFADYTFTDIGAALSSISSETSLNYQPYVSYLTLHRFRPTIKSTAKVNFKKRHKYSKVLRWRKRLNIFSYNYGMAAYNKNVEKSLYFPVNADKMVIRREWYNNINSLTFVDPTMAIFPHLLRIVGSRISSVLNAYTLRTSAIFLSSYSVTSDFSQYNLINDEKKKKYSFLSFLNDKAQEDHLTSFIDSTLLNFKDSSNELAAQKKKFLQSYIVSDTSNIYHINFLINFFTNFHLYMQIIKFNKINIFGKFESYLSFPLIDYFQIFFEFWKGLKLQFKQGQISAWNFLNELYQTIVRARNYIFLINNKELTSSCIPSVQNKKDNMQYSFFKKQAKFINIRKKALMFSRLDQEEKLDQKNFYSLKESIIYREKIIDANLIINNLKNQLRNDFLTFPIYKKKNFIRRNSYQHILFEHMHDDLDQFEQEEDILPLEFEFDEDRFYIPRHLFFFVK